MLEQLGPENLGSDPNQQYIEEAIRRRMLEQQAQAQVAGSQVTDKERQFLQETQAPKKQRLKRRMQQARANRRHRRMRVKASKNQQTPIDLLTELWTKDLITGSGERPAEGLIPYAEMPEKIRKEMPMDAPPVGWDPSKLSPEKLLLIKRLSAMGRQEAEARRQPLTPEQEAALVSRMQSGAATINRQNVLEALRGDPELQRRAQQDPAVMQRLMEMYQQ